MIPTRRPYRNAEIKLKAIGERLNAGTWMFDPDTSEVIWSDGLFRMLGLDRNAVIPTFDLLKSLMHPDDRIEHEDMAALVADLRIRNRRFRIIRPDGRLIHIQNYAEPYFDRSGRISVLFGVAVDVTAEESVRHRLRDYQQVTAIMDELGSGSLWRADREGRLKDVRHWKQLTGQTTEEARDWTKLSAIHPDDRADFKAAWQRAIDDGTEYKSTIRARLTSGDYVTIIGRGLPVKDAAGEIVEWLGFSRILGPTTPDLAGLQPAQIRAARALLDWSAQELAARSGISFSTLRRMEKSTESIQADNITKDRHALLNAGIALYNDGCGRIGATLAL